ncbi:type II toxin-antitoxin system prevent-host-death family antitoxin [Patescibacteria group bacterium]|nr:type II toxin-antitoxin system prevent-host-death family antitoxin [Patescibacteria group bacterium]MBU1200320.1 type II toxin-antitoxin system prevent-host-death family antitoxin [Patescibacteria group bacterium]MBU1256160.1 type II toxin-antitoxin system prevent-host-death family antitoxin [Patescibacteria group bacterium]MBU1457580.1 type II toxin-antitoxin system prevent-host-death family antitoxin [Patescibacteria group bacterium]
MRAVVRTATEARREFFDLVNAAMYGGQVTWITKGKRKAAKIMPIEEKKIDWVKYKKDMRGVVGLFNNEDFKTMKRVRKEINDRLDKNDW